MFGGRKDYIFRIWCLFSCIHYLLKMKSYNNNNDSNNSNNNNQITQSTECRDLNVWLAVNSFLDCHLVQPLKVLTCLQASSQRFRESLPPAQLDNKATSVLSRGVKVWDTHSSFVRCYKFQVLSDSARRDSRVERARVCMSMCMRARACACVVGVERELACSLRPLSWACLTYEPE